MSCHRKGGLNGREGSSVGAEEGGGDLWQFFEIEKLIAGRLDEESVQVLTLRRTWRQPSFRTAGLRGASWRRLHDVGNYTPVAPAMRIW